VTKARPAGDGGEGPMRGGLLLCSASLSPHRGGGRHGTSDVAGACTRDGHPWRYCCRSVCRCCVLRPAALLLSSLSMSSRRYAVTSHKTGGVRRPWMALLLHDSSVSPHFFSVGLVYLIRLKQHLRRKSLAEEDAELGSLRHTLFPFILPIYCL
jgi:hypothetical protein